MAGIMQAQAVAQTQASKLGGGITAAQANAIALAQATVQHANLGAPTAQMQAVQAAVQAAAAALTAGGFTAAGGSCAGAASSSGANPSPSRDPSPNPTP